MWDVVNKTSQLWLKWMNFNLTWVCIASVESSPYLRLITRRSENFLPSFSKFLPSFSNTIQSFSKILPSFSKILPSFSNLLKIVTLKGPLWDAVDKTSQSWTKRLNINQTFFGLAGWRQNQIICSYSSLFLLCTMYSCTAYAQASVTIINIVGLELNTNL